MHIEILGSFARHWMSLGRMSELTRRQRAIYEFIRQQVHAQGMPPTLMEIAEAFGLSSAAGVSDHLKAIERKGYIRRRPGVSRGIEVRGSDGSGRPSAHSVPLIGTVPSTRGVDRGNAPRLAIDRRWATDAALAFEVATDGLQGDGLHRGDVVLVDPGASARPGDFIVGRQGPRTALLRVDADGRAAAPVAGRMDPAADVRAYGTVVAVLRSLRASGRGAGRRPR